MMMTTTRKRSTARHLEKKNGQNKHLNSSGGADTNKKMRRTKLHKFRGRFVFVALAITFLITNTILFVRTGGVTTQGLRHPSAVSTEEPAAALDEHQYLEIDFQGGGDVGDAYRLGDVFAFWLDLRSMPLYAWRYPNTLAHQYYREIPDNAHGHRNLTAFLRVVDRVLAGQDQESPEDYCRDSDDDCSNPSPKRCSDEWWACQKSCGTCRNWQHLRQIQTPGDNELVVHLRLGDVLTDPNLNEVDKSMEELWNRGGGFLNIGNENQKYNYNKHEFVELIRRIPASDRQKIDKCTIMGAGFITSAQHAHRNEDYKRLVSELLETELGCSVKTLTTGNPDRDFLYMASANYFIAAMGGYAQLAAACVTAKRGWGHALYDVFNGYLPPFFMDEKTKEYIDWSQVDYHPKAN